MVGAIPFQIINLSLLNQINMKRKLLVILTLILVISWPTIGFGITTATPSLSAEQIQLLNRLLTKVAVLQAKLNELQAQAASLPVSLRLTKQLSRGTSDEEIKVLQEMLATDPEIYPEGHTTGYFGPLTEKALRKFQKKTGLTDTGKVDGQTLWRVNQLLTEGAGHSGKIPPGLLRAPGILKKLGGGATTTPPGGDILAPTIISLNTTSTLATSTRIIWQTNELTVGTIRYATTTPVAISSLLFVSDLTWQTNHQLTLADLSTSTTYYYYLLATDYAGNHSTSTTASFTTSGQ